MTNFKFLAIVYCTPVLNEILMRFFTIQNIIYDFNFPTWDGMQSMHLTKSHPIGNPVLNIALKNS